jgi:hypothetical protein
MSTCTNCHSHHDDCRCHQPITTCDCTADTTGCQHPTAQRCPRIERRVSELCNLEDWG